MSLHALRLALLSLVTLTAAEPAAADLTCSTAEVIAELRRGGDADADDIRCTRTDTGSETGTTDIVRPDMLDGLTVRSSDPSTDAVGDIIDRLRQSDLRPTLTSPRLRPSFTSTPDGLGGAILRDNAGAIYNPPTDGLGNSTVITNDGQILRCHTDDFGVTTCD